MKVLGVLLAFQNLHVCELTNVKSPTSEMQEDMAQLAQILDLASETISGNDHLVKTADQREIEADRAANACVKGKDIGCEECNVALQYCYKSGTDLSGKKVCSCKTRKTLWDEAYEANHDAKNWYPDGLTEDEFYDDDSKAHEWSKNCMDGKIYLRKHWKLMKRCYEPNDKFRDCDFDDSESAIKACVKSCSEPNDPRPFDEEKCESQQREGTSKFCWRPIESAVCGHDEILQAPVYFPAPTDDEVAPMGSVI